MKRYAEITGDDDHSSDDDVIMDTAGADRVCAVVFSGEGAMRARHLLAEIPLKDSHVLEWRVHDKTQLAGLPRCQAYLMFVDYNRENVVLETDTATQGFLLLNTVQHLQSIKGSQMALVYIDDSGIVPPSGQLYSDHIQEHPIIADLCHKRLFFSVRYKWNSEQAESLKTWLPPAAIDKDRLALQIDSTIHRSIRYRREKLGYLVGIVCLVVVIMGLVIFLLVYYQV